MCCGCCCCNANCCCDPFKYAGLSAFFCMVEAAFMFCVHTCLILVHTCTLPPPPSFGIFEEAWAWFFYDEEYCYSAQGSNYTPPLWIQENPIPDYFHNTTMASAVSPGSNFVYQIIFLTLHSAWGLSAFVLLYGNARKLWEYYVPWLFIASCIIILDIVFASFYIALWDQSEPGWEDSQSFFYMFSLYLQGYIFVIFNIIQFMNVFHAFNLSYKKRSKQKKREKDLRKELGAESQHQMQQQLPGQIQPVQVIHFHNHSQGAPNNAQNNPNEQFHYQDMVAAPNRFRPFSYISKYRPSSPSDIENMKKRSHDNAGFDNDEKGIYPKIEPGPAPSAPQYY